MMPALLSPAPPDCTPQGHWLEPLQDWPTAAIRSVQATGSVVRIMIASVRGSAPRESGTSMLVDLNGIAGTIGGGQLEWSAIEVARHMLADSAAPVAQLQKLILGPQLAQCCGGAVQVWFERFVAADLPVLRSAGEAAARTPAVLVTRLTETRIERRVLRHSILSARVTIELADEYGNVTLRERLDHPRPSIWLYGAGHVGQAVARVLAALPIQLTWIDSRAEMLPLELAPPVQMKLANDPVVTVADAPPGTRFVVMTHSHVLDYQLCKAVLDRGNQAWLGLIGSTSKSVRFRSRLLDDGISQDRVASLICPIGVDGIESKLPAVIAVSVAAQLLQTFSSHTTSSEAQPCSNDGCRKCDLTSGSMP
ncbi:MAG TPA: xanthine dehydrogenase accessory protein XdhC [Steroidobacter sp.]